VNAAIPVGSIPFGMAVTPDGGTVYVANNGAGTVSAIATATNLVTATIPIEGASVVCGTFIQIKCVTFDLPDRA
jgi:YVTN family beta-propeller protein